MSKYTVILASVGNPDHGENPNETMPGVIDKIAHVDTLEQASQKCIDFISENDLGSGNWSGGGVYEGEEQVASISYNGRIWPTGIEGYRVCD